MTNIIKKTLPVFLIPLLAGCVNSARVVSNNTTAIASIQNTSATEIYFSCEKCQGNTTYQFFVTEKNELSVASEVTVAGGSVAFVITDPNNKELYNETLTESANFSIPLETYGKHKLKVVYEAFKGKYKLNWAKK